MQRYADFAPTGLDARGAFLDDRDDWLVVPVSRTRDSGPLDESNFASAWASISEHDTGEDCETHRFGHWGPGWFEVILVQPGTACAREAEGIESALARYPVLDEDDYSEREWNGAQDFWSRCSVSERVRIIQEYGRGVSIFAAREDTIPRGDCGRIFDYCREDG